MHNLVKKHRYIATSKNVQKSQCKFQIQKHIQWLNLVNVDREVMYTVSSQQRNHGDSEI